MNNSTAVLPTDPNRSGPVAPVNISIFGSLWFTLVPFGPLGASPAAIADHLPKTSHPALSEAEPELSG